MAKTSLWRRTVVTVTCKHDSNLKPLGLLWRSNTFFILATIAVGMFSDLFLFALIVPILPFILQDRLGLPYEYVQRNTSGLLAAFAIASVLTCPLAGWISDRTNSRQLPFLGGLAALMLATLLFFLATTMPILIIARFLQGISSAFVWTIGMTLALDTVGIADLGKTIGSLFSIASAGQAFAPAIGGALYAQFGVYSVLALSMAVLVIDLVMRLLVIEKRTAARFISVESEHTETQQDQALLDPARQSPIVAPYNEVNASETTRLLSDSSTKILDAEKERYLIPTGQSTIITNLPILYPLLHSSSLAAANLISFTEAFLISAYDATVPTQANEVYGFDSQQVGLLFLPLSILSLIAGPLGGWVVDRYGTKVGSTLGYAWLVPVLILLRLPAPKPFPEQVYLWAGLLGLIGIGTAISGSPGIVEAGIVLEHYHEANPDFFGPNGPYAQLYGVASMTFNLGLTIGPIVGGELKDRIGYGNMNAVLAGLAAFTSLTSLIWLGGPPKLWKWRD